MQSIIRTVNLLTLLLASTRSVEGLTSTFQYYGNAFQNYLYGTMCLANDRSHIPTCGWQIAIRSDYPFFNIDSFECANHREDDYFYLCTNKNYNFDLTYPPSSCYNLNIQGDFWSTNPVITTTWYCVCNDNTNGCEVVEGALPTTTTTTTTTPPPPPTTTAAATTTTTTTTTPTAPPPTAMTTPAVYQGDLTQILMTSDIDGTQDLQCYIGHKKITLHDVSFLGRCVASCLPVHTCSGVNYWSASRTCDLIEESTTSTISLLNPTSGCQYLEVVFKM